MKLKAPLIIRRVSGASMLPTLRNGKIILASSWLRVHKNSIVIARYHEIEVVKRVTSIKGSVVQLSGDNLSKHHMLKVKVNDIRAVVFSK